MNRREFIDGLSRELRSRTAADQAAELLEDFNLHFDEALRAGKSEEAICEMLGDPAEIAAQCAEMEEAGAGEKVLTGEAVREAGACPNLSVKLGSWNLRCASWDGEKFRIAVTVQGKEVPDPRLRVEEREDALFIEQRPDNDFSFAILRFLRRDENRTVKVDVPRGFRGEISVQTGSGNISLSGLKLEGEFRALAGSGNINIEEVSSGKKLSCQAGSGNLNLKRVSSEEKLAFLTGSGNINLMDCSGKGKFQAGSGNINVMRHRGTIGAMTGSGNQNLQTDHLTEEAEIKSGSGMVSLSAVSLSAGLKLESGSGGINFNIRELRGNVRGRSGSGSIHGILSEGTRARFILRTAPHQQTRLHNDFWENGLPEDAPVVDLMSAAGGVRVEKRPV